MKNKNTYILKKVINMIYLVHFIYSLRKNIAVEATLQIFSKTITKFEYCSLRVSLLK